MNHSEGQLERVKQNVQTALNLLPDQFVLGEIKNNLRKTLFSINEVQNKRIKRKESQKDTSNFQGFTSMEDAKRALDILDRMMQEEEKIIKNSEQENSPKQTNSTGLFLG